MKFCVYCSCVVFICLAMFESYEGKTFSLNKAIEEERIKSRHREGSPTDNEATTFSRGKTIAENRNRRSRHPEESLAATFLNIHRPRITDK
ncbi:unnamed protein product [Leptidea sinapis]|uniref:Uncharacterized protein n=1 Tax=Leptidea sinapis TaxID=189913 RepID=A0A5E4R689_9NEOP|nr:unnamed protein product [Leptidea sinapis]